MATDEKPKLSEEEFVRRAIKKLRGNYKGIHTIYSGFNQAFRDYFKTNPFVTTQRLAKEGKITILPVKGGVMLYLPEDAPTGSKGVLQKILEKDEELEES